MLLPDSNIFVWHKGIMIILNVLKTKIPTLSYIPNQIKSHALTYKIYKINEIPRNEILHTLLSEIQETARYCSENQLKRKSVY